MHDLDRLTVNDAVKNLIAIAPYRLYPHLRIVSPLAGVWLFPDIPA